MKDKQQDKALENLDIWWDITPNWTKLPYDKKLEFYWKFKYINGKRVFDEEAG